MFSKYNKYESMAYRSFRGKRVAILDIYQTARRFPRVIIKARWASLSLPLARRGREEVVVPRKGWLRRIISAVPQGRGHIRPRSPRKPGREKPAADDWRDRTKTDCRNTKPALARNGSK
jgi:hypothetical protein